MVLLLTSSLLKSGEKITVSATRVAEKIFSLAKKLLKKNKLLKRKKENVKKLLLERLQKERNSPRKKIKLSISLILQNIFAEMDLGIMEEKCLHLLILI